MPLPAALLARLAKRGIVKEPEPQRPGFGFGNAVGRPSEEVEEVFAEDYDDMSQPSAVAAEVPPTVANIPAPADDDVDFEEEEVIACPQKWNPYHECVEYCRQRYGLKSFTPDPTMLRRRDRMLRKYPLPDHWQEVPDIETDRYYYWNKMTDEVSWLSPIHPKAHITVAAKALQDLLKSKVTVKAPTVDRPDKDDKAGKGSDDEMDFEKIEEDLKEERDRDRRKRDRRGRKRKEEELDPMDPASYSDVPRGNWSTGLERRGEAKTGVDVTASGPLFQQRPYPSPGDILRANQKAKGD